MEQGFELNLHNPTALSLHYILNGTLKVKRYYIYFADKCAKVSAKYKSRFNVAIPF